MTLREEKTLTLIDTHKYLTTSMIAAALYPFPSGPNKCRKVMAKMHRQELVSRFRTGRNEYIYHLGRRSQKWRHWLDLARFHFTLKTELKSWQKILFWQHEVKYDFGIADGFYIIRTTIDGGRLQFFLEVDDGNNSFDKIQKYRAYHASRAWRQEFWGPDGFPRVLIVTPRMEQIQMMTRGDEMFNVIDGPVGIVEAMRRR